MVNILYLALCCIPLVSSATLEGPPDSEDNCDPGSRFRKDCNFCTCNIYGHKRESACTGMTCPSDSLLNGEDECKPGKLFLSDDGCTISRCSSEGQKNTSAVVLKPCQWQY